LTYQVIKQPGDQLAIFSTYTDTIIVWDATPDEITQWFVDLAAADAKKHAERVLDRVLADDARAIYFQFAMTWDKALEMDREHGGEAWKAP
jgi:hypothetical protein